MPQIGQKCHKWTEEDNRFLLENYENMTVKELAEHFKMKNKAVRGQMERLKIDLKSLGRSLAVIWTDEDIYFLKENWMYMQDAEISEILGVERGFNRFVVGRKRKFLGLMGKCKRIRQNKEGYKYHIEYDKAIYTHREKMEKKIRRKLQRYEIVHHIDGDKSNDDIDNLYLCKNLSEHTLLHDGLEKIAIELVQKGIVKFDKENGKYYIE